MAVEAVTCVEKEKARLHIDDCAIIILPQFCCNISSILLRSHELLQAPLAPYTPRTRTMSFDERDASGWEECLPSVANRIVPTVNSPADVPDHGDLWRVAWQVLTSANGSISMQGECFSLPLKLLRIITLSQTEKGYCLHADHQVTNTSAAETPWSWPVHPGYASILNPFRV